MYNRPRFEMVDTGCNGQSGALSFGMSRKDIVAAFGEPDDVALGWET